MDISNPDTRKSFERGHSCGILARRQADRVSILLRQHNQAVGHQQTLGSLEMLDKISDGHFKFRTRRDIVPWLEINTSGRVKFLKLSEDN